MSAPEFKPDDHAPKPDENIPKKKSLFDDPMEKDEPRRTPVARDEVTGSSDSSESSGSSGLLTGGGVMAAFGFIILSIVIKGGGRAVRNAMEDKPKETKQALVFGPQMNNSQNGAAELELWFKIRQKVDLIRKFQRANGVTDDQLNAKLKEVWCSTHSAGATKAPWEPKEPLVDSSHTGSIPPEEVPVPSPDRLEWLTLVDWDLDAVKSVLPFSSKSKK